ncbi:NAD(P)H-dependent amine dehydrogenase family protein [Rhodococcus koreensis]
MDRPLRIVQWATGRTGTRSLQAVIDHPHLDLVGVWVHSPEKVGLDAGQLCGRPPTGVHATHSIDEILELDADCVLYMAQGCDIDALSRILASGKNVVSSRFEFLHPPSMDPHDREVLERACSLGASSLHGTGSSPGFVTEALPLVLLSIQRRLELLTIDEFADMRAVKSPQMLFTHMCFGRPLADFDPASVKAKVGFAQSLRLVGDAVGRPLDAIITSTEVAGPKQPIEVHGRTLSPHMIAAQRTTVAGFHDGDEILRFRANWYCTSEVNADWEMREVGWRIQLEGDSPLDIAITNPVSPEILGDVAPNKTPFRIVNAIPYVCAAPPGIRTTLDLPQIIPHLAP